MPITKASSNAVAPAAKGDLVVGNATNDSGVLAVGSANQVLTVDSSTATGLKWATASSGSMTLLSTTTLSGSDVTVSGISQSYTHLYVSLDQVDVTVATGEFYLQPNACGSLKEIFVANATWSPSGGAIHIFNQGTDTNGINAAGAYIMNYSSTTMYKPVIAFGGNLNNASADRGFITGAMVQETNAITSMYFRPSANSFNGGTMRIYGVN
jgi:hypothetical protein